MENLETVLGAARHVAPYALFGISLICSGIALLNSLAGKSRRQWEDDANCMYPGWRKLYEISGTSPQSSPEPEDVHKQRPVSSRLALAARLSNRVLTGLAAGALGVEALFFFLPRGVL
ncbi:hypothetical protein [Roseibium sediminicola]|uniref:Uncharacterized protein n=1 Tax=Roseibium sediminicola TaxID=2933272 RepID=A0ABT0H0T5_9HYPH|nr:hypothetical protein [Roseibium sp. CAU 1639]MCK7615221.1 hypothetical protein [Roseibium sp. CAU 1639]